MKAEEYIQRITSNVNKDRVQKAILILEEHANQRVIEELEKQMELAEVGNSYTRLRDRIKELKDQESLKQEIS